MENYIADVKANGLTMESYIVECEAELSIDNYIARCDDESGPDFEGTVEDDAGQGKTCKKRAPNAYNYMFGNMCDANWYRKFLHPDLRPRTYHLSSRDRFEEFRCLFCLTLSKVDEIVLLFIENG